MSVSWFDNLKNGLKKSSTKLNDGINLIFKGKKVDKDIIDELETLLISSDVGISFASRVLNEINKIKLVDMNISNVKKIIENKILEILNPLEKQIHLNHIPFVIFVVGVNGVGKTATVGKLANKFSNKKVAIVAGDTFRAAAADQLEIWSKRTNSIFFSGKSKSDPASLIYSSFLRAKEDRIEVLIVDTAGRLHNKSNLMDELSKMTRVIKKLDVNAPHETILILDGNTGQNSIKQAEVFQETSNITGLIITKLDGTAKGGVIIPIAEKLELPILGIGVGEQKNDLIDFKAEKFSKALLDT